MQLQNSFVYNCITPKQPLNGKKKNYTLAYFSGLKSVPPVHNLLNNTLLKATPGFWFKTNLTCSFPNQSTMGNSAIPLSL